MKILGKDFAPQELIFGAFANILAGVPIGLIAISSLLWMLGGTFWKPIRRFGIPLLALLANGITLPHLVVAAVGCAWLHVGDGFPDRRPTTADEGSWLGRLVERIVPAPEIGGPITKVIALGIYMLTTIFYAL